MMASRCSRNFRLHHTRQSKVCNSQSNRISFYRNFFSAVDTTTSPSVHPLLKKQLSLSESQQYLLSLPPVVLDGLATVFDISCFCNSSSTPDRIASIEAHSTPKSPLGMTVVSDSENRAMVQGQELLHVISPIHDVATAAVDDEEDDVPPPPPPPLLFAPSFFRVSRS